MADWIAPPYKNFLECFPNGTSPDDIVEALETAIFGGTLDESLANSSISGFLSSDKSFEIGGHRHSDSNESMSARDGSHAGTSISGFPASADVSEKETHPAIGVPSKFTWRNTVSNMSYRKGFIWFCFLICTP